MKIRIKKASKINLATKVVLVLSSILIAVMVPMQMSNMFAAAITSDEINAKYDAQKAEIQKLVDAYTAQAAELSSQAATLQSAVATIQNQASVIQAQIDISQIEYDKLVAQIAETEKQILDNKDALGITIASMYVDGNITPIEMLASSGNIGDYLDKQEYSSSIRNQLASTIKKVKELKVQLETQKVDAERVLNDQKNQRNALLAKQNEQQQLLDQTKGQEVAYQQLSTENKAKIDAIRIQQAAELAAIASNKGGHYTASQGDGSRGGYPTKWLNGGLDAYVDDWGMYTRECVSYAAFKVDQAYGNMPYWGGIGNANQWDDNARNIGIPYGNVPKAGSVGVIDKGDYGHVAWVESVNADGTINISHFNIGWNGEYAEWYNVNPSFFNIYIYFGEWKK